VDALTPGSAAGRAAARLLAEKSVIAHAVTETLYAERPYLMERYGANGRARTLEDMHFNVEHLIPAVDLGEPELFATYVRWLDALLRARNVPTREVVRCLELMEAEARARFAADEAEAVADVLRVGLAALPAEAGTAEAGTAEAGTNEVAS
jgi:hypothetical protein